MDELKKYYTVRDLADALNLTPDAVRRYIIIGELKAEKFNRTYIIDREDAEKFIKQRTA